MPAIFTRREVPGCDCIHTTRGTSTAAAQRRERASIADAAWAMRRHRSAHVDLPSPPISRPVRPASSLSRVSRVGSLRLIEASPIARKIASGRSPECHVGTTQRGRDAALQINEELRAEIAQRRRAEEELRAACAQLRRTCEETINAIAFAVEMRDPYTAGHQRRVADLSSAIARELDLPEEQATIVRLASLIHDIGKIAVPTEILNKPAPISEWEFGLIKVHPQVGHDILRRVDLPWPIADIVLQHHEAIDGSGYPKGLRGSEICLEARILSVADVAEAMTSHRPYRPALDWDAAAAEISRQSAMRYDPVVADACIRLLAAGGWGWAEDVART